MNRSVKEAMEPLVECVPVPRPEDELPKDPADARLAKAKEELDRVLEVERED